MKTYSFTAVEAQGRQVRDQVTAVDLQEALRRIHQLGLYPLDVREQRTERLAALRKGVRREALRVRRLRPKVLVTLTRQLATLVRAGMPLLRGLQLLGEQESDRRVRSLLRGLAAAIENGGTFSEALAQYPGVFDRIYINLVKAGEIGGVLDVVLLRLAEFLERTQRIKGKVRAAMFYPAAVIAVALVVLGALMVFVVPRFRDVFGDLLGPGAQMPAFTRAVLGVSTAVAEHCVMGLLVAVVAGLALAAGIRTRGGRRVFDAGCLKVALLGPVLRKAAIARFSRTLGTLLNSGVPVLQSLAIVREASGNAVVAEAIEQIHRAVKDGENLAPPMRSSRVFPATVIGLVDIGEQTGALPDMLGQVADVYDNEVDNAVTAATSLLEPVMIVFLALFVGSIVIALFLPLIDIIDKMTNVGSGTNG